jgi:hypothetical protein
MRTQEIIHPQNDQQNSNSFIRRGIPNKKVRTVSMATFLSNSEFTRLATEERIAKTVLALEVHSIRVVIFETSEEARKYVLDLIPSGADVYNSRSRTLELIG